MAKTWFITGTSAGFGRIMTEALLARGDRVAQLVPAPVTRARLMPVEELDDTARGLGGFGSTGV